MFCFRRPSGFRVSLVMLQDRNAGKLEAISGVSHQDVLPCLTRSDDLSLFTCLSPQPSMTRFIEERSLKKPLSDRKLEKLSRIASAQYGLDLSSQEDGCVGRTLFQKDMDAVLARVFNAPLHKQLSSWRVLMVPEPIQRPVADARFT